MKILNIGILAHVDAGKTSLTEQILYTSGIVNQAGSVDQGTTSTDTLEVEKRRGITVKSAAISFNINDTKVNLIDTPGHADFISEVEHSLGILDGAILVISAVEGVQSQTKILMQTLIEYSIPTIIFINKLDRLGANIDKTVQSILTNLTNSICIMNNAQINESTKEISLKKTNAQDWIEILANNDDLLLEDYINDKFIPQKKIVSALSSQTKSGTVYPVFMGSAIKGSGVSFLLESIIDLFPTNKGENLSNKDLSAFVFKINKNDRGEKTAYVRLYRGKMCIRNEVSIIRNREIKKIKVKQLYTLQQGKNIACNEVIAGDICIIVSNELKVGDIIGVKIDSLKKFTYQKPSIQVEVFTDKNTSDFILHEALIDLTHEDPFLEYKMDNENKHIINIFGKVQQEILAEQISSSYGINISYSKPKVICIERPKSSGNYIELISDMNNPFIATIGLKVEPGEINSGIEYSIEVELGSLPLSYHKAIKESVFRVLNEGLYGWPVTDIKVTLTHTEFASAVSTASDFRNLTPLVLMGALEMASTNIFEPINKFQIIAPSTSINKLISTLNTYEGVYEDPVFKDNYIELNGTIPVRTSDDLKSVLHSITKGEGLFTNKQIGYDLVRDSNLPVNNRTQINPLSRSEYLLKVRNTY